MTFYQRYSGIRVEIGANDSFLKMSCYSPFTPVFILAYYFIVETRSVYWMAYAN